MNNFQCINSLLNCLSRLMSIKRSYGIILASINRVIRVWRDAERTKGIARKAVPSLEHGVLVDML